MPTDPLDESVAVQFYGRKARYPSLASLQVTALANGNTIGAATGFFVLQETQPVFVTNWHVLSGRNTETGQPIHESGAIPDSIVIRLHDHRLSVEENFPVTYHHGTIPIYNSGHPSWIQHPEGQDVDVAAIRLGDRNLEDVQIAHVNIREKLEPDSLRVGDDVFIVGFPEKVPLTVDLPIWKRGTIASEPLIDKDSLGRMIYVDSSTRSGMSGSPVYLLRRGGISTSGGRLIERKSELLWVGIYSGRIGSSDKFAADIGRLWHAGFVADTVNRGVAGSYELR